MTVRRSIRSVVTATKVLTCVGALLVTIFLGSFAYWALFDRAPPFILLSVNEPAGVPGEVVLVDMRVWRDVDRHCSVTYSRFFYDADGAKIDIQGAQSVQMNAPTIVDMERRTPGGARVPLLIPPSAQPGMGELVTPLSYVCNPAQHFVPLVIILHVPIKVLPHPKAPA